MSICYCNILEALRATILAVFKLNGVFLLFYYVLTQSLIDFPFSMCTCYAFLSILIKQVIVYRSVCLSVRLWAAKPQGLTD